MEKSTNEKYRAEDGITDPKGESSAIARLIFDSLQSEKLLAPKAKR